MSGPDFGECEGQVLILVIPIYDLNISMDIWYEKLSYKLMLIGLQTYKSDTVLYMRYCGYHYKYITAYSKNIIVSINDHIGILIIMNTMFPLKVVGDSELYLCGDVVTTEIDGKTTHVFSEYTYIKKTSEKIDNIFETTFNKYG